MGNSIQKIIVRHNNLVQVKIKQMIKDHNLMLQYQNYYSENKISSRLKVRRT